VASREDMTGLLSLLRSVSQIWSTENLPIRLPIPAAMYPFSIRFFGKLFLTSQVIAGLDAPTSAKHTDIVSYVDPLIGTTEGGKACESIPQETKLRLL